MSGRSRPHGAVAPPLGKVREHVASSGTNADWFEFRGTSRHSPQSRLHPLQISSGVCIVVTEVLVRKNRALAPDYVTYREDEVVGPDLESWLRGAGFPWVEVISLPESTAVQGVEVGPKKTCSGGWHGDRRRRS